jgi:peptidoglycan/LPS O-acetylase OafA/YrhL
MYFKNLDGFRTLACFAVLFQHSMKGLGLYFPWPFNAVVTKMTEYGEVGVQFFFVLSGFLITYLILTEKESKKHLEKRIQFNLFNFYMRRLLRIWPIYFLILFFAILVAPMMGAAIVNESWMYPTFLSNIDRAYFPNNGNTMSGITWSVAIEEQFYIFWPIIFLFKRGNLASILFFLIGSVLFKILNYNDQNIFYFHTFSNVLFLTIGGLFAHFCINNNSITLAIKSLNFPKLITIYLLIFLFLFNHDSLYKINKVATDFVASLSFAFIIVNQCFGLNKLFEMSRFKLFSFLGKYTYGMYLIHPVIIFILGKLFLPTNILHHVSIMLAVFICTTGVSMLSYHFFESYFLRIKKKFK